MIKIIKNTKYIENVKRLNIYLYDQDKNLSIF